MRRALGPLWRNRDFRLFWGGETVSLFGTQVTTLALPLTAILVMHSSAAEVGLLRLAQLLPYLLLSLVFGAMADRRRLRPLMIGSNALRLVLIGLVPLLSAVGVLRLDWLYLIAFGAGAGAVVFDVCWISYVPVIVSDRAQLVDANTKLGVSASTADIAGPGLAGVLIGLLTAPIALVVDAASYAVSVVSLLWIGEREPVREPVPGTHRNLRAEMSEGARYVFGSPLLRPLALLGACYNFFLLYTETVFLVYAVRSLRLSATVIGVILSCGGVGGLLGALAAGAVIRKLGPGRVYGACAITAFSVWLLVPAAGGSTAAKVLLPALAFLLNGIALGITNIVVVTLRQTITPKAMMARMNAVMRTLLMGIGALGGPVGGFLAGWIGLRTALWVGAAGAVFALVTLFPRRVVTLREFPAQPTPAQPSPEPDAVAAPDSAVKVGAATNDGQDAPASTGSRDRKP